MNVLIHDTHTQTHNMRLCFNKTLRFAFLIITKQTEWVCLCSERVVTKQEEKYKHTREELTY